MAAAIGFALANYVPEGWPRPETPDPEIASRLSDLESGLSDVTDRVATLAGSIESLSADVSAPDPETEGAVSALRDEIGAVREQIAQLEETVSNLPAQPSTGGDMPDFTGQFNERMDAFQAEIDRVTAAAEAEAAAARQEAEDIRAAAERAERQAALRASLAEVEVAVDTGAPFEESLSGLDGLDIPPVLSDAAETGVTPLAELQRTFPEAARAALRAAPRGPEGDDGAMGRITSFLMAQTNARSLEPREGNDTDAVLSRAEADLRGGDLAAALSEVSALPDAARQALGDWVARAEARQSAKEALASLASEIDAM